MSQTFSKRAVLLVKLGLLGSAGTVLLAAGIVSAWTPHGEVSVDAASAQPIPFSHKHHVGDVGLDCRFCHVTVEHAAAPGMPSAQLCLTCHSQLFADQAILAPLRRAATSGLPIAWTHVTRLPDYVYFDHSVHLAKGVACIECHGRIDQMPLTARPEEMTMKWCIACHDDPRPHLRPPEMVFAMPPPRLSDAQVLALSRLIQLEPRQRLTDCSTCHR